MNVFTVLPLSLYFIALFILAFRQSGKTSHEDFLIGKRKIRTLPLAASLCAGLVGGATTIMTASLAFEYGLSFIWIFIGGALGFIAFLLFSKKIRRLSDKYQFYTLSDYFSRKYSKKEGITSALLMFIAYFAFVIVQFIAGGKILSAISGLSYSFCVLIMGCVVILYLISGGFKAVIKTDTFQYALMFVLALVLVLSIKSIQFRPSQLSLFSIGAGQIIGFTVLGVFSMLAAADVWQRAFAAADHKTVQRSFVLAAILILLLGLAIGMIGISAHNTFPGIDPEDALYYGFTGIVPPYLLGVALVFLFSAIMSTLDTCIFISALNITRDMAHQYSPLMKKKLVSYTKYIIIGLSVISMIIALFFDSVITIMSATITLMMALSPAIVASFYFRMKRNAVFLSLTSGLVITVAMIFTGTITIENSVISLPVALVTLVLGQLILRK